MDEPDPGTGVPERGNKGTTMPTIFSRSRDDGRAPSLDDAGAGERAARNRCEGLLVLVVVAVATIVSVAMVPTATGASLHGDKGDQPPGNAVAVACAGQAWGHETRGCVVEMARASGLDAARSLRIVVPVAADAGGPEIF